MHRELGLQAAFGLRLLPLAEDALPRISGCVDTTGLDAPLTWTEDGVRTSLATMANRMVKEEPGEGLLVLDDIEQRLTACTDAPQGRALLHALAESIATEPGPALGRRLLRDFVREASDTWPALRPYQLSISLTRVGDAWQTFERELRDAAGDADLNVKQALGYLLAVRTFEETFWDRVLDVMPGASA